VWVTEKGDSCAPFAPDDAEENSGLPFSVSFGQFFHGSSVEAAIGEDTGPLNGILLPTRAPFGAELQQDQGGRKESTCEKEEPHRILAGSLFDDSKKEGQEKTSQATGRANQSREKPDAFREALRQELKNRSIPHAHHSHGQEQEPYLKWKRREPSYSSEATRHTSQEQQKQAIASDLVREPTAHGPQETSRENNDGRKVASANF
jgi:hypothetical protein